jgi:hypothetical protein
MFETVKSYRLEENATTNRGRSPDYALSHITFRPFTSQTKVLLTLIGPGEVKVDLADFDLKLRENLLNNLIFLKIPFPAKTSSESF